MHVSNLRCRLLRARDSVRRKAASFKRAGGKLAQLVDLQVLTEQSRLTATPKVCWTSALHCFSFTVQNGSFVATNSTGAFCTNPFNQRVHSSIPPCSLGTCPITINALLRPCVTASAAYSTVSHSRVSPPAALARHRAPGHASQSGIRLLLD
jgi:hypothetical protein